MISEPLFSGYDGQLHSVELLSGSLLWSKSVSSSEIKGAPLVTHDVAIVGTHGGQVLGLSASHGALLWRLRLPGAVFATPALRETAMTLGASSLLGVLLYH